MSLYNSDGQIRVTVVNGNSLVGLQAPDGSINVVINDGTKLVGRQHPSGAVNAVLVTQAGNNTTAPNGSMYITEYNGEYVLYNPGLTDVESDTTPTSSDIVAVLGSDLIAYWDVNRADLITMSYGMIKSWKDVIGGYNLTAADDPTSPTYNSTGLAGSPSISFSNAQYLTSTDASLMSALPAGANPSEMWALVKQEALVADTNERYVAAYGGSSIVTGRGISRIVSTTNKTRSRTGTGAASSNIDDSADMSDIHVIRQTVGATQSTLSIDGATAGTVSAVPSTTNTRIRVGSISAAAPSNNWQGQISAVLITLPLSASKVTALHNYFG